jgi:hypothetical protein
LSRAHEEGILSRSKFRIQVDFVGPDPNVLGLEGNFLVPLNSRFAAGNPTEGTYLKFPPIAFFIEFNNQVIGGISPLRNV